MYSFMLVVLTLFYCKQLGITKFTLLQKQSSLLVKTIETDRLKKSK